MLGYFPSSFCFLGIILMNMYIPEYFIYICSLLLHRNSTVTKWQGCAVAMFFSSIILLIWCCRSSPYTSRRQPTMGRNSWLVSRSQILLLLVMAQVMLSSQMSGPLKLSYYCYSTSCSLLPKAVPLCQRQPNQTNQTKELSDLLDC